MIIHSQYEIRTIKYIDKSLHLRKLRYWIKYIARDEVALFLQCPQGKYRQREPGGLVV